MFNEGISRSGDLLDTAVANNIVTKAGAFYTYKVTKIGQGRENAKLALVKDPKLAAEIEKQVLGIKSEA